MQQDINAFLQSVERRAYSMAFAATHNRDEALDIVQESMMKLAVKYTNRPEQEWGPLFTRILQSKIRDWYRRAKVRSRIFSWFGRSGHDTDRDDEADPLEQYPAGAQYNPLHPIENEQAKSRLQQSIAELPLRQQQAFILRAIEQLDVAATAAAMGVSEGSVKTHYSRAIQKLQDNLQSYR